MEQITANSIVITMEELEVRGQSNMARVYNVIDTLQKDATSLTGGDIQTLIMTLNQVTVCGKHNIAILYKAIEVLNNSVSPKAATEEVETETYTVTEEANPHEHDNPQ